MRKLALALTFVLSACSSQDPDEPTSDTEDRLGPKEAPPVNGAPTVGVPKPAPPEVPDALCQVGDWCLKPYAYPDLAVSPNAQQQCYCLCDPNASNADCAASPLPSECGVMFDLVAGPSGPMKVERFPTGYPFVCRYTEFQQAN